MKKLTTFLFFFLLIALGVILMLLFTKGVDITTLLKTQSVEESRAEKKKKVKKKEKMLNTKPKDEESELQKEEKIKEEKETVKNEIKEEKKDDENNRKEKEENEKGEDEKKKEILNKEKRKGKYWVMLDYSVKETGDFFEVTGSVYDAALYAEWVDAVGSEGMEEKEKNKKADGFRAKNLKFLIPKNLRVKAEKVEWFEIEEKSVKDFFDGAFGTFLFENEGNQIIEMLDWYMNYSS